MSINKVAIGVPSPEVGPYSVFYDSLLHMKGLVAEDVIQLRGANVAENRNLIQQVAKVRGYDAILYLDNDQVMPPDTLSRLVARDLDVVSGLYLKREPPFIPHAYHKKDNHWWPHCLGKGESGLIAVDMTGAGCLLVKMSVFDKLERPYWTLGQGLAGPDKWGDDEVFCTKLRAAGYQVYVDLDCPVGHQLNGTILPGKDVDGNWGSMLWIGRDVAVTFQAAQSRPKGNELWD